MKKRLLLVLLTASIGSLLFSCKDDEIPAPTVTSFTPTSGPVGTSVTITGTNFSTTPANNTVSFNGIAATVTASTATSITTTVPTGASTGTISVTVNALTATSATDFTVSPAITSFTPDNGVKDVTVTITGTNFSTTPASNIVKFNGTAAVVTASTATSITTTVPVGATTGTITVEVGGQIATSATSFRVDILFTATLSGANEVPANNSTATGTATLVLNNDTKIFTLVVTYTGLSANPTNGHIHKAAAGVNGSPVFAFASPWTSPINYTSRAITAAEEADLHAALYYVNIHSSTYPGGEIRGQLIMQ
jgi:CHRD domain/IPT/TIG domain